MSNSEIMTLAESERRAIEAAMELYRGNKRTVAKVLGIARNTLYRKLEAIEQARKK